ncbi:MAG: hypothetical protein LBD15_04595 [Holosporales bacterium]|jgi:hypothetical protein|nr:hypothetical protein [Holosporales bacterium]
MTAWKHIGFALGILGISGYAEALQSFDAKHTFDDISYETGEHRAFAGLEKCTGHVFPRKYVVANGRVFPVVGMKNIGFGVVQLLVPDLVTIIEKKKRILPEKPE